MAQGWRQTPQITVTVKLWRARGFPDLRVRVDRKDGLSSEVTVYEEHLRSYEIGPMMPTTVQIIQDIVRQALLDYSGAGTVKLVGGDAS